MPFRNIIQVLRKLARVALASVLFVGVPMADAFACAAEKPPVFVAADTIESGPLVAASDSHDHDGQTGGDAQHCIDGHCHHGTAFRGDVEVEQVFVEASASVMPHETVVLLTRVSGGLERPPKA